MELKSLNAKKVRIGAKKGMTMDEFCRKYDCSVEQFGTRITQLYGGDMKAVSRIINEIEANAKLPRPQQDVEPEDDTAVNTVNHGFIPVGQIEDARLEQLKQRAERLEREIKDLDALRANTEERSAHYLEELSEIEAFYAKIREELIVKGRKFDKIAGLANELVDTMNATADQRQRKVEELNDVRARIAALEETRILVTGDGTISTPGNDEFLFNEAGSKEWLRELLDEDSIIELRLREVRVLARLLAIVDNAWRDGIRNIVVEFENAPELARAYETLS